MPRVKQKIPQQESLHKDFSDEIEEIRIACEQDIFTFAKIINPHRIYGDVHKKILRWLADGGHNKLYLVPRDHQKSHCMAVFAAWLIARDPAVTILYLSATATLAEKQLYQIKNMLETEKFRMLWPNTINKDVGSRDRWTNHEINVDHPIRKKMGVRDATITCGGLTKTITGLHPQYILLDDIVVPDNAYTEEGRLQVKNLYSQLASIESNDGYSMITGTRYHPDDIYSDLISMEQEVYNQFGDYIGVKRVYDVYIDVVEKNGIFLWPKEKTEEGKEYGFDRQLLATKRAKYLDQSQFYAQYYNNPNMGTGNAITRDKFTYYEKHFLKFDGSKLYFKDLRLNLYAAMDFAYSKRKRRDYTAIVVIGMDYHKNIYILDIIRFKTTDINEYLKEMLTLQAKWGFQRMAAEVSFAQQVIVDYMKDEIRKNGANIVIDEIRPSKHTGSKEERMEAALKPLYENKKILHYEGNMIKVLENELTQEYPDHDDVKETLSVACVNISPPSRSSVNNSFKRNNIMNQYKTHPMFGGVMRSRKNVR